MDASNNDLELYADLIIQHLSETISGEDLVILKNWINSDKKHKDHFEQTREIWLLSKVAVNSNNFDQHQGYKRFLDKIKNSNIQKFSIKTKWIILTIPRVAALFLLAFGLGILFNYLLMKSNRIANAIAQQEIIVPLGSKSTVKLPDGTIVTLNAGSRLTYNTNYDVTNREVNLEGEGYFSVAKHKKKTFVVKTGYLDIKAIGTEFNVKAYPNEKTIQTTLVEGSVKIEKSFKSSSEKSKENTIILTPKQKYTFLIATGADVLSNTDTNIGKADPKLQKPLKLEPKTGLVFKNIDPIPDISWKERRWIISREQLGQLAIKLERRYDVKINFQDEKLKQFKFTGTLQDESIEQVLKVISISSPIVFEIKGKQVILYNNDDFAQKYKGLYKH